MRNVVAVMAIVALAVLLLVSVGPFFVEETEPVVIAAQAKD